MDYFVKSPDEFTAALDAAQKGDTVYARGIDFCVDDNLSIVTPAHVVIEQCTFWRSPQQNWKSIGVKDMVRHICGSEVI